MNADGDKSAFVEHNDETGEEMRFVFARRRELSFFMILVDTSQT